MSREIGLRCWCLVWVTLLLMDGVMSSQAEQNKSCIPSGCGIITDIRHPFRLRNDPPNCGDQIYELACENNVPLLNLYNRTYRVLGINYNNYTIRIVDPGIQEGNCSSLPLYFLSRSDFTDTYNHSFHYEHDSSDPYGATLSEGSDSEPIFKHVVYLNCSDPVRDDTAYVDSAPCVNQESEGEGGGHVYAVAGDLLAEELKSECRVKLVAPITSDWDSLVHSRNLSYADIHRVLSYGFELSWWRRACFHHCPSGSKCRFSSKTQSLQCSGPGCMRRDISSCRKLPKWRILGEDYLSGVLAGLRQIVRISSYSYDDDYKVSLSNTAIKLGIFTGRVVLPYITVRGLFGIVFLSMLLVYTCHRRHKDIEDFIALHNPIPIRYSYKELKTMTQGFKNKLGEGAFGTVYKGKLRSGSDVAIRMLGTSRTNGKEFISEVATIGRIHHFNVVHLVGFCVEEKKRALIYEFMSNGSLDKYIFSKEKSISLSYHRIYEISLGVARGIAYLHHCCEMQILHFDIKPHNILLDDNFVPKISDFGLAEQFSLDDLFNDNFVPKISDFGLAKLYSIDDLSNDNFFNVTLTGARGTIGYMAPELFYKNIGKVSYKADVYSFGMLLMEMAGRRKNFNLHVEHSSQLCFPLWIYDQFDEEKDIDMEGLIEQEKDLAKKMFIVALWCIQLKPADRPSMNKVIEMLEVDDIRSLEMPPKPSLYP